jgi:thioredoxin 1
MKKILIFLSLIVFSFNYSQNIVSGTVTDANFEEFVLKSSQPVLVDFWAEWCGPCRMLGPIIEELSSDYDGKAVVGKVDVDSNQQFAAQFGVRNIPTVLIFKDGELVNRQVGVSQKSVYSDYIDALL